MGLREDLDHQWEKYWNDGALSTADRQFVINAFIPLARAIGRRLKAGLPAHVPYDDLVSSGLIGLINAVDRFDPGRGYNFRRYAAIRIKGAMLDELRQMDWAPRSLRRDNAQIAQLRRSLEDRLGRRPTTEEMANGLDMDLEGYHKLIKKLVPKTMVHIEDLGYKSDRDKHNVVNFLSDPNSPDPARESEMKDSYKFLADAVEFLKERHRQVLTFYYFESLNLKEIATIFQVTESRISQIHSEAIARLRKKVNNTM